MSQPEFTSLNESQPGSIAPELLAKKIADVRRLHYPTLAKYFESNPRAEEALWSMQWFSMQPGGFRKFVEELLAFMEPRLGTKTARALGRKKYTRAECLAVWQETGVYKSYAGDDWSFFEDDEIKREVRRQERESARKQAEKEAFEGNEPYLHGFACKEAKESLTEILESLCIGEQEQVSHWWCADVLDEVIAFVDARAERVKQRLANTVVAERVFDALDYATSERVMVRVEGESRFGKTESIETYAAMWPGRVRVVRTPSSTSERDLIKAVAEAYGMHQSFGARSETYKDKVEFTIRFSGLMIIFDEGAFLLPSAFTKHTAPARLNWVRCSIVDRKIPCVIVVTPQAYHGAVKRFVDKTQYSIEQFLGREALRITLPNELSREDLLAVARVHFPEADDDLLTIITAKAMQSESYLKAVESIARRARYNSRKRGGKRLSLADVDTAIDEVMPSSVAAPIAKPEVSQPEAPRQRRRSAAAQVLQPPFRRPANQFPAREIAPLNTSPEGEEALATG